MDMIAREQWVQSQSAYIATATSLVNGIVGLFTLIPLGFISDRYGRKCGLLIAYTGFAIEATINGQFIFFYFEYLYINFRIVILPDLNINLNNKERF